MKAKNAHLYILGGVAVGAAVLGITVVFAGPAKADNGPHVMGTASLSADGCAGCHRAHTAKSEGLLKTSNTALCTSCHAAGVGALTDVMAGQYYPDFVNGNQMMGLRGGGFQTASIDTIGADKATTTIPSLAAPLSVTSTHSIDGTAQTAWGSGDTGAGTKVNLNCTSCHDPHGNGNYRILRPLVTGGTGPEVNIADAPVKKYMTANYWEAQDVEAPAFISNISSWCTQCHTRYLSDSGSTNTGDPIFTFRHMSNSKTAGGPNCIQCHVAHGTNATMGGPQSSHVPLPDGTVSASSRLLRLNNRGVCVMCHAK